MPKRNNKRRLRGGGFFEGLQQSFTNFGNSVKSGTSDIWNKTKKATSSYQPSQTTTYQPSTPSMPSSYDPPSSSSTSSMPSYDPPSSSSTSSTSSMSYGGSRRRRTRKTAKRRSRKMRMRGGYRDNISLTNLASNAGPFSGSTARVHNWVGGRRKKRRTRSRTRRH